MIKKMILLCVIVMTMTGRINSVYAEKIPFGHGFDILLSNARSINAGDINRDGYIDLVGASSSASSNSIACRLNVDGSGTNWSFVSIWTNSSISTHLGDIDADGDLDCIAINLSSSPLFWNENVDGTGTNWNFHVITTNWSQGYDLQVTDIDGDSYLDVVAYSYSLDKIDWWQNVDGDGIIWTQYPVATGFDGPTSLDTADIDRDGDLDVVGTARNDDDVCWFENVNGSGTNWIEHVVAGTLNLAQSASVADINNDGLPDIVAAGQNPDIIQAYINVDGSGTNWLTVSIDTNAMSDPTLVYTTDLDRDGDMDVLCASRTAGDLAWYDNALGTTGSVWTEYSIDLSYSDPRMIGAADVNGDGNIDYLAAGEGANAMSWFTNLTMTKTGGFTTSTEVRPYFSGAYCCWSDDFDSDGDMDIVASALSASPELMWAENLDGQGHMWTNHEVATPLTSISSTRIADINQDGRQDILATSYAMGDILWWSNPDRTGTNLIPITVSSNFAGVNFATCADMNHNGYMDIIGAGTLAGQIAWWENSDGNGVTWTQHTMALLPVPACAQALDVDQDGDMDIAGVSYSALSNDVCWWENVDGSATNWSLHVIEDDFSDAWYNNGADIDLDGDIDIYAASLGSDGVCWWENLDRSGTAWARHEIDGTFAGCRCIQAGDLDQDGDIDMTGVSRTDNTLSWWENVDGTATNWIRHDITMNYITASWLHIGDINQDGMPDLITTAMNDNSVNWWQNRSGQYNLEATSIAPDSIEHATSSGVFKVTFAHAGRATQTNAQEWATGVVRLESAQGEPMLAAQMDDLFNRITYYLDDGNGSFDPVVDTAIWTSHYPSSEFQYGGSTLTNLFPDGQSDFRVAYGETNVYFIELTLQHEAHTAYPNAFVLTLLTGRGGCLVKDFPYDSPLRCHDWEDTETGTGLTAWAQGDVGISKTVNTNEVYCGGPISYTIALTNFSTPIASGIVVTDSLPTGLTMTTNGTTCQIPGNVLRLHMDESPISNNTVLTDSSGYTHNGIFRNAFSMNASTTGKYDGGVENGSYRYIDLGNPPALNFSGEITLAAWINPDNTNAKTIFAHGADNASHPALYFSLILGRYAIGVVSGATEFVSFPASSADVGTWTHVAAVYDQTYWRIYYNGTLAHAQESTFGAQIMNEPWSIGAARHDTYTNEFFEGKLDEVMIFNRALSGREMHEIYAATTPYATMSGSSLPVATIGELPGGATATMSYTVQIASNRVGAATNRVLLVPYSSFIDTNTMNDQAWVGVEIPTDYDQDQMYDPWEYPHQFSPTNPADALIDSDGDHMLNVEEYIADTDPHASNSFFHIIAVTNRPAYHVSFLSSSERIYSLQQGDDLVGETWSNVPGQVNQPGTGGIMSLSDTNTISHFNLHRVHVILP